MASEAFSPAIFHREIAVTDYPDRNITFQLEPDDYIAANRLHARLNLRRPLSLGWFTFIALAIGVFVHLVWTSPPRTLLDFIVMFVVVSAIASPVIGYLLYLPYKTRRVFREQKNLHYPLTMSWSADGFKTENQRGSSVTPWEDYFKWGEDGRILLLYHSSRLFHMLPKRVLTEAQVTDLRQFIKVPRM